MKTDFDAEKYCEAKYKEACENWVRLEHERLTRIYAALGSVEPYAHHIIRQEETLEDVRKSVELGDRQAMLDLLDIATDSFRVFEVMPLEVRLAIADGLEKMRENLEQAKGFLPRKRGERSREEKRSREFRAFFTTLRVEDYRLNLGLSLDEAEAKVADEWSLKQDLVHKLWKQAHREARQQAALMKSILEVPGALNSFFQEVKENKVR